MGRDGERHLAVRAAARRVALPLGAVIGIASGVRPTRVPGSPVPWLQALAFRGEAVAALPLSPLLGGGDGEGEAPSAWVVVAAGRGRLALGVDAVLEEVELRARRPADDEPGLLLWPSTAGLPALQLDRLERRIEEALG